MNSNILLMAGKKYLDEGISVVVNNDRKFPIHEWKKYEKSQMELVELCRLVEEPAAGGIGIVCGYANIEALDFDLKHAPADNTIMKEYRAAVESRCPGLIEKMRVHQTKNNGYHFVYFTDVKEGNQVLARNINKEALIETRGDGGQIAAPPTPGYTVIPGFSQKIQTITADERNILFEVARSFNQVEEVKRTPAVEIEYNGEMRPGDDFSLRGDERAVLETAGWQFVYENSERSYYRRPGDTDAEHSGNWHKQLRTFKVFSTSTEFDPTKAYRLFSVYTILLHGGNHSAAAAQLRREGYGKQLEPADFDLPDFLTPIQNNNTELLPDNTGVHPNFWEVAGKMDIPAGCPPDAEMTDEWFLKLQAACPEFVASVFKKMNLFTPVPPGVIPEGDYFSDAVYENLPPKLKAITDLIDGARERDIALIGMIVPLSAAYSRFRFIHGSGQDINTYSPHIMALIIGAAGRGKGNMRYGKEMVKKLADDVAKKSDDAFMEYQKRLIIYNKQKKDAKTVIELAALDSMPIRPPKVRFEIALADTNKPTLIGNLKDNEAAGVFGYESEIDTLVQGNSSKDFGGYGDIFRKAFHHETVGRSRQKDNEGTSIDKPRIAFIMSGTLGQLIKLIPDDENGLFSRNWYYVIPDKFVQYEPAKIDRDIIGEACRELQLYVFQTAKYNTGQNEDVYFTPAMERELVGAMQDKEAVEMVNGRSVSGSWFRIGIIVKRIAVTLAAFQGLEQNHVPENCWRAAMEMLPAIKSHCLGAIHVIREKYGRTNLSKEQYDQMKAKNMSDQMIADALGTTRQLIYRLKLKW